jgi:hypothetical protein
LIKMDLCYYNVQLTVCLRSQTLKYKWTVVVTQVVNCTEKLHWIHQILE